MHCILLHCFLLHCCTAFSSRDSSLFKGFVSDVRGFSLACAEIFLSVHGMQGRTYSHFPRSLRNIPALGDQEIKRERFDKWHLYLSTTATAHATTWCSRLRHTATHCNTLHVTRCNNKTSTLQHTATHCNTLNTLQHNAVTTWYNTLRHTWTHYMQHASTTWCSTLQHTATHCNTLQHTATHCNTLQHTTCNTLQQAATQSNLAWA